MSARREACRRLLDDLSAYLDGELPAPGCRRIEAHCAGCVGCAHLIEGLRRTIGLCRDAGKVPVPGAIRERARARVRQLLAPGRHRAP